MALISAVHIETAVTNNKTILKKSFFSPPFKIADVTEDKSKGPLQLMVMSSSPGVLDGDEYRFQIDVSENSYLQLKTQSYQRLFQMNKGAVQFMNVNLGWSSSFCYLPHPLVPHQDSKFLSRNKIHVSDGSSLIWGEVMSCGRKLNGEVFKFSSYHSITEIFKDSKLVVKENLLVNPGGTNPFSIGQLEGYTHQASLIFVREEVTISNLIQKLVEDFSLLNDISFGVTELPVNGLIVRLLGHKAEQLFDLLKTIAACCDRFQQKNFIEAVKYVS
jgi:urease accessory protein